jgi:histone-lysine N-methyltransferase SETD2
MVYIFLNIFNRSLYSCDPNAITQKWTVGRQLRIGFFALKPILSGEEITFNYQFERYG